MNKYAGISCPVCGKNFTDTDDVVVCPDCGSPHHRDCYQELGSCVFSSRHAPDFTWENPAAPAGAPGASNPQAAPQGGQPWRGDIPFSQSQPNQPPDYTRNFNDRQNSPQGPVSPFGAAPSAEETAGIRLDECIDGVSIKDFAQYIGPNAYYYLLRFKAFARAGQGVIVSFSAFIFSFLYYFYRKMYRWGFLMLGAFLLCMLPTLILAYQLFPDVIAFTASVVSGGVPDAAALNAASAAHTGLNMLSSVGRWTYFSLAFLSGMFANKLYFEHAKQTITGLHERLAGRPDQELSHALAIRGRTNIFAVVAVVGALVLAYLAYYALLFFVYRNLLF